MASDAAAQRGDAVVQAEGHPAPGRHRVGSFALWFGLLGAPAAWSVQTLVNLPIASHACFPKITPLEAPQTGALRDILFVVSIVAIVVSIAALATAVRAWQQTRGEHQTRVGRGTRHHSGTALAETGEGRTRFMTGAGVLTSLTFLLVSVMHTAVVFLAVPACGG